MDALEGIRILDLTWGVSGPAGICDLQGAVGRRKCVGLLRSGCRDWRGSAAVRRQGSHGRYKAVALAGDRLYVERLLAGVADRAALPDPLAALPYLLRPQVFSLSLEAS